MFSKIAITTKMTEFSYSGEVRKVLRKFDLFRFSVSVQVLYSITLTFFAFSLTCSVL